MVHYESAGIALDITATEVAYTETSGELVARKGVTLNLRGHEVIGEHLTVDINAMTARMIGPGIY